MPNSLPKFSRPAAVSKIKTQADIVFCIDATGSMQPCIDGVKQGIGALVEGLKTTANVDYRLRLVGFRDKHDPTAAHEPWTLTEFTPDAEDFLGRLGDLQAFGGGDAPESSLDALYLAIHSDWRRRGTYKCVVLLTDEDAHPTLHSSTYSRPDNTIARVIQDFQELSHVMLHMIVPRLPIYEWIEASMVSAERKIVARFVPYHLTDRRYQGLAAVDWTETMLNLGRTVSASSLSAIDA